MLAHTKTRRTSGTGYSTITVKKNGHQDSYKVLNTVLDDVIAFIKDHSEENESAVEWEVLAKDRLEKYKKSGLMLRGIRYRDNVSQKALALESGVSQNEISKIENGKRAVGEKVAKRLAKALNIDYLLLIS